MTRNDNLQRIGRHVANFGRVFMTDMDFYANSSQQGFSGLDFYVAGRAGVLGDVSGDVVASIFGFHEPGHIASMWEQGTAIAPAASVAAMFADDCAAWSVARLSDAEIDAETANALLERVIAHADSMGRPLFAAWRRHPLAAEPLARLGQQLNTMREHRGATHLLSMTAAPVPPHAAAVLTMGDGYAELIGFQAPHPDPEPYRAAADAAMANTERVAALAYDVLTDDEVATLAGITSAVNASLK